MTFSGGSVSDPFAYAYGGIQGTMFVTGRSPLTTRPSGAPLSVIGLGQSNIACTVNATYAPTNASKIFNLNFYDGGIYQAADPLLGPSPYSSGGCWMTKCADLLIAAGDAPDGVILTMIGIGSTTIEQWAPGGEHNSKIVAAARRCEAVGYPVDQFWMAQGESSHGMTQSDYQTELEAVIQTPRDAGFDAPWLVAQCTYTQGTTDTNVRAAQAAVVNGTDIFAGPDMDTLTSSYRHDNVHFNSTGRDAVAALWKTAIEAVL